MTAPPLLAVQPTGPSLAAPLALTSPTDGGVRLATASGAALWTRDFVLVASNGSGSPAVVDVVVRMNATWRLNNPSHHLPVPAVDYGVDTSTDVRRLYLAAGEERFFNLRLAGFVAWDEEDFVPRPTGVSYVSWSIVAIDLAFPTGASGLSVAAFNANAQAPEHVRLYGTPW